MTDNTHPSYPNPTIQEALCEVRFPVGLTPFSSQFAHVWDRLRDEFFLEQTLIDVLPPPAPNVITTGLVPTQPRFVLRHAHRAFVLQFTPGTFTLNTLPPYLGWQTMREDMESAWQKVQGILVVPQITQITLRYINRIPLVPNATQGWITAGDYVPGALVKTTPPFHSRVQTGTGTDNIKTLSIGQQDIPGTKERVMLADIERNVMGDFAPEAPALMERAEALHTDIWEMFKSIKGPHWNDILEGKPQ